MMSKTEMVVGFAQGRRLIQEEWSQPLEIEAANECIEEGLCTVLEDWHYDDNFQCEFRHLQGVKK